VKEGGAESVKLEGGERYVPVIEAIGQASIPVVGHLGLTPQSLHQFGGYVVQGKDEASADRMITDAKSLERAGCFAIVLECIPWRLAERITAEVSIPTIGIGAGPHCDGQVLVLQDMLGLHVHPLPRFVKKYDEFGGKMRAAAERFVEDVKNGGFPGSEHSYEGEDDAGAPPTGGRK
jgi:3-methyl-2-oxobutanoate hydroxymethyltransferase